LLRGLKRWLLVTTALRLTLPAFRVFAHLNEQLLYVRRLLRDPNSEEAVRTWNEEQEASQRHMVRIYIDGFFLALISLYCLYVLFSQL
jgi:hypothetical protein